MKSDYFVEFLNHDLALKQEEKLKFIIEKYKQNIETIKSHKVNQVNKINSLLSILDAVELSLKSFKKLMPIINEQEKKQKQTINKPKQKHKKPDKIQEKPHKDLRHIKLGLEKIRDELENM